MHVQAPAAGIHDGDPALVGERRVAAVRHPTSGAVVLGSTQPASDFDEAACHRHGLEVTRRRSGGGAVLVRPGAQVWIDFFLPRGDPLLDADVVRSFSVVGAIWVSALQSRHELLGPGAGSVSTAEPRRPAAGPREQGTWSRLLCFGGIGASEVTVGGRKAVGIAQRRDRAGAWFYSMVMLDVGAGGPGELGLLLADPSRRHDAASWLDAAAVAVPGGPDVAAGLTEAVLHHLPGGRDPAGGEGNRS
ncbi:MAG: lipoyl protein ligase domain-containing protein [Acidimicrobiales bacterium]